MKQSTARYWAQQAYRLRVCNGRTVANIGGYTIRFIMYGDKECVEVMDDTGFRVVPVAKSWL